jgi:MFS family permease
MHIGKLAPALPSVRADLGLGMVTGGWIVSIMSVVGLVLGMAAGVIGDKFGAARTLAAGLVVCAIGGIWGAVSTGALQILLSRMVEGLGFIFIVVPAAAVIAGAAHGPARRLAFGIWGSYMPVGTMLTFVLAPTLLSSIGWRGMWGVIAACCLLCLVPVARYLDVSRPVAEHVDFPLRERLAVVLSQRGVWLTSMIFAAYAFQWIALMIWLPTLLVEGRGVTLATASLMTAGIVLVNIPGNLMGGWLLRHGVKHWQIIFAASVIMGVSGFGVFAEGTPFWLFYGCCMLFSGCGGMLPATALACGALFVPDPAKMGAANGLIVQGAHLGQVAGPPALAALVSYFGGWSAAGWLMAAGAGLAMIMALMLAGYERRASAP